MNKVHLKIETLADPKELFNQVAESVSLDQMITMIKEKYWSPVDQQKIRKSLLTGQSEEEDVSLMVARLETEITLESVQKLAESIKKNWPSAIEAEKTKLSDFSTNEISDYIFNHPDFSGPDSEYFKTRFFMTIDLDESMEAIFSIEGQEDVLNDIYDRIPVDELKDWFLNKFELKTIEGMEYAEIAHYLENRSGVHVILDLNNLGEFPSKLRTNQKLGLIELLTKMAINSTSEKDVFLSFSRGAEFHFESPIKELLSIYEDPEGAFARVFHKFEYNEKILIARNIHSISPKIFDDIFRGDFIEK